MNSSIRNRLAATALSTLLLIASLVGCNNDSPSDQTGDAEPPKSYAPYVLDPPKFTEDNTDYRAMTLSTFADIAPAPAADFTYQTVDGGIRLTAYTGSAQKLILPTMIDGKPVVSLADALFRDNTALTALSIPESVTEIGENLLTGCRSLQLLQTPQLGKTRKDNGYLAYFFGADTPIGMGFKVPSSLDTVILLDTVTKVADNAFMDCSRLRMVLLSDTLTSIGAFAFSGCSQLHFIPLPASLETVGQYAFTDCTALIRMHFGSAVKSIGIGALMGCHSIEQLTLPFLGESRNAKIAYLGYIFGAQAYTWNSGYVPEKLLKVTLTEGNVPDYAFYGCDHLALVELSETCTSIGIRAFWGCVELRSIALPNSLRTIGELAFAHCVVLGEVEFNEELTEIGLQAFYDCYSLTEITLPSSLTALPASAFADCRCLTKVTLGANLVSVGAQAFRNCISLKTVNGGSASMTVAEGNEALTDLLPSSTE